MAEIVFHKKYKNHYEFRLSNKPQYLFLCDLEDFHLLFSGKYYVHVASRDRNPYIRTAQVNGKHSHFHREIMKAGEYSSDNVVDHRSTNTLDCRKKNLRITNQQVNSCNRRNIEVTNETMLIGEQRIILSEVVIKSNGKDYKTFQAYDRRKYIGSSVDKEKLRLKVIAYFNQGKVNVEKEKRIKSRSSD